MLDNFGGLSPLLPPLLYNIVYKNVQGLNKTFPNNIREIFLVKCFDGMSSNDF